jgi:hypothetical protein
MIVFRPIAKFSKSYRQSSAYNWHENTKRYPSDCQTINRQTMFDIFGRLHYLAWHAPERVQHKWRSAEKRFRLKHDPPGKYCRWILKYTASSRF